jgi:hypothetical protein
MLAPQTGPQGRYKESRMRAGSPLDRVKISFGKYKITLYRRTDVRVSSWFFSIHLKEEDRKYRKSLNTDDLEQAKVAAQTEVINILAKLPSPLLILSVGMRSMSRALLSKVNSPRTPSTITALGSTTGLSS